MSGKIFQRKQNFLVKEIIPREKFDFWKKFFNSIKNILSQKNNIKNLMTEKIFK